MYESIRILVSSLAQFWLSRISGQEPDYRHRDSGDVYQFLSTPSPRFFVPPSPGPFKNQECKRIAVLGSVILFPMISPTSLPPHAALMAAAGMEFRCYSSAFVVLTVFVGVFPLVSYSSPVRFNTISGPGAWPRTVSHDPLDLNKQGGK